MNDAKERADALRNAVAISVRDVPTNGRRIHVQPSLPPVLPGISMFSDRGGHPLYVGVAETSIRDRITHHVYRSRIGKPWTLRDPPPEKVLAGRNLLGNVLKDRYGRLFTEPNPNTGRSRLKKRIDRHSEPVIRALNSAVECIHNMNVQWVRCPDRDTAIRAEHCAICQYEPNYVEK